MLRFAATLLLPLALLTLAACAQEESIVSTSVITKIPWHAPETTKFRVLDHNDKEVGTGTFKIESEDTGNLRFTQHYDFTIKGFTNDSQVVTEADTLRPISTRYIIDGPDGRLSCEAAYTNDKVTVHRVGQDGERDDTLSLPKTHYDSWTDLFLWRTIDFKQDFTIEYGDSLSCTLDRTQAQNITLNVKEQQSITVPAGTFDTWHVEIESGGSTQDAWYTSDAAHQLVKYDNGDETFELTDLRQ
jgi:hypothetical protein